MQRYYFVHHSFYITLSFVIHCVYRFFSNSKCYNVIKRFSEDVDVSIERAFLTSQESIEPDRKQSSKENQRRLDRLKQACQEKIADVIIPELKDKIGAASDKRDADNWVP